MADQETPKTETTEQSPYNVTVEEAGPARKKLTIEVPESVIKEKFESLYSRFRDDAVLPGFRRGRAPRRLIEKRFGEDIQKDAKAQLLSEAYTKSIEEQELDVIGEPELDNIDEIQVPESGSLTFDVTVEITPDIELPNLSDISVTKDQKPVTDEDVTAEIDRYRDQMGKMVPVEDADAKIAEGDFVQCDAALFAGHGIADDAEAIQEQEGTYVLVHGEDHDFKGHVLGILVNDMGKRLTGQGIEEPVVIEMDGPSGHENEQVKDQPITIRLNLKRIERLEPAPIESLAEQMGVENADEVNTRLRQMLEQRNERQAKTDMHQSLMDQLIERTEFELPEGLTNRQAERAVARRKMELMYQGMAEDQIEEQMAEMRSGSQEKAVRDLQQFFILDKAAKDLEVEVEENEMNGRIAMYAMQQGRRPERVRQEMAQRGELENLYLQLREQKTLDKILESVDVQGDDAKQDEEEE